ncbi:MAG TPA: hypothetical protein VFJ29_05360 [Candidatus Kapabacteria bacterium]|nr:hypothetical protein [Candidatus Kapabacteria bacterium]
MRLQTLSPATIASAHGTIRGGSFIGARKAASILMAWLLKSGRVPHFISL